MPVRRLLTSAAAALATLALLGCEPVDTTSPTKHRNREATTTTTTTTTSSRVVVKITAPGKACWAGQIGRKNKKGCGSATHQVKDTNGNYRIAIYRTKGDGSITVVLVVDGKRVQSGKITGDSGIVSISYAEG